MKKSPASIEDSANAEAQKKAPALANAPATFFHSKPTENQATKEKTMQAYKNENGQFRTPAEIAEIKRAAARIGRPWQAIAARPIYAAQVIADYRRLSRFDRKPFPVFGK